MSPFIEWFKLYKSETIRMMIDRDKEEMSKKLEFSEEHCEEIWNHQQQRIDILKAELKQKDERLEFVETTLRQAELNMLEK